MDDEQKNATIEDLKSISATIFSIINKNNKYQNFPAEVKRELKETIEILNKVISRLEEK